MSRPYRVVRMACSLALAAIAGSGARAASPGESVYKAMCALCHQQGAAGLSGQFPRLKGRLGSMLEQPQSRRYVIAVLLNGMAGSIEVDHAHIVGVMLPFRSLSDQDIAAVLAYVANLDSAHHGKPVTAAEVAQVRTAEPRSAMDMHTERDALLQAGSLP